MKTKIVETEYNDGYTKVVLATSIGNFIGESKKSDKDPLPPSRLMGGQLAESRAYLKYYKELIKRKSCELKGLKRLITAMPPTKEGSKYVKNLYNIVLQEYLDLDKKYNEELGNINNIIEGRAIFVRSRTTDKKEKEKYLKDLKAAIKALGQKS